MFNVWIFFLKNGLNLRKLNLKFELKSNFEVRELDISKLKKYQVELDYYKNQGQRDRARVMTSASCVEKNKYLLDSNRDDKHLHFRIDFGHGIRRNITYFVSHPGYHYEKV